MKLVVRTASEDATRCVKNRIWQADQSATFDKEGNPVTFWVVTKMDTEKVMEMEGVLSVIVSVS